MPRRDLKNPELLHIPVGESVFIPGEHVNRVINRIWHYRPRRYTCRTVVWRGQQGVRVRRIA